MLSKFDYCKPKILDEAIQYLVKNPTTKILAGGTDLMILLRRNILKCDHILDIKSIPELKRLDYSDDNGLFIGATATVNEVSEFNGVEEKYPALKEAADSLASYQLRNRATVIGNICNASPGADLAGPLLVYDAIVHIAGPEGNRQVPLKEFYVGFKKLALGVGDLVVGIQLPAVCAGDKSVYLKQARIKGHDLGIAGAAIRLTSEGKVYIGMSAVAPTPIRLFELEKALEGKSLDAQTAQWVENEVKNHINPISDIRSSAEYRLQVSGVLVKRGLMSLVSQGGQ